MLYYAVIKDKRNKQVEARVHASNFHVCVAYLFAFVKVIHQKKEKEQKFLIIDFLFFSFKNKFENSKIYEVK